MADPLDTLTPAEQATFARNVRDFWWFAANAPLKIQHKDAAKGVVTLKPNAAQRRTWQRIRMQNERLGYVRKYVPKFRQGGLSTAMLAELLHFCVIDDGVKCSYVSHNDSLSEILYDRALFMFNGIDPDFPGIPKITTAKRGKELAFDNGSSITFLTVKAQGVGLGGTRQHLRGTEMPFWEDPELAWQALEPSVTKRGVGTSIILESTCRGAGDMWHQWCMQARAGEGSFEIEFLPWYMSDEYRADPTPYPTDPASLTELELVLLHRIQAEAPDYGMASPSDADTTRMLHWRRTVINDQGWSEARFRYEYPMDLDEAFGASGETVFDRDAMGLMQAEVRAPRATYEAVRDDIDVDTAKQTWHLEESPKGKLRVWEGYVEGERYSVVVDTASGTAKDKSAVHVLRYFPSHIEQVAVWHGDINEVDLAYVTALIGHTYGTCIVAVENVRTTTIDYLHSTIHYPNLYRHQHRDRDGKQSSRVGWNTNTNTRPAMIEELGQRILDQTIIVRDAATMGELTIFTRDKTGKPSAPRGAWDDLVMALAIGVSIFGSVGGKAKVHSVPAAKMRRKRRARKRGTL